MQIARTALAVLLATIAGGVLSAAGRAQAPAPGGEPLPPIAAAVANYMGVCQCIADHKTLRLERCVPGASACQQRCGSTHYAFVPLSYGGLAECGAEELYVVLPNADGRPGSGAITVEKGSVRTLLDRPFAASAEFTGQRSAAVAVANSDVDTIFGRALAARPMLPSRFLLFFPLGSVQPTPESQIEYRKILDDIRRRPVYEVEVIGYTDTVADPGLNRTLGLERAQEVRRALLRDGVAPRNISVASRGKLDLLVPTPDQFAEPRNRRVEITVR